MSKLTNIVSASLPLELQTDSCQSRQSSLTCVSSFSPVPLSSTEDLRTWLQQGSHVSHLVPPQEGAKQPQICGQQQSMSSKQLSLLPFSQKTSLDSPLWPHTILSERLVTLSSEEKCQRKTWVQTMLGQGIGYVHTPTCAANYWHPSMMKHPSAKLFLQAFGKPSPIAHEWLMGWPIGWTDLKPLETAKFRQWLDQHGNACPEQHKEPQK
jgi:hypothetical protein